LVGRPSSLKNMHFDFLSEIEDGFVATKDYIRHLLARGVAKDQLLQNGTLMLLDKNNMTRQYIDEYFQENDIQIKDPIDITDLDLLIEFTKIGVGIGCVVKNFVRKELDEGSLIEIPLKTSINKREVGFVYKTNTRSSKSLAEFINFYKKMQAQE